MQSSAGPRARASFDARSFWQFSLEVPGGSHGVRPKCHKALQPFPDSWAAYLGCSLKQEVQSAIPCRSNMWHSLAIDRIAFPVRGFPCGSMAVPVFSVIQIDILVLSVRDPWDWPAKNKAATPTLTRPSLFLVSQALLILLKSRRFDNVPSITRSNITCRISEVF